MLRAFRLSIFASLLLVTPALAQVSQTRANYNSLLLETIEQMPVGGGWDGSAKTTAALPLAIEDQGDVVRVHPERWMPSYCTGATYLAFLSMVENLHDSEGFSLDPSVTYSLLARNQPDGTEFWGWFNSNGPGVPRLMHVMGLGVNFTDWKKAKPGDFIRIWWTDAVGAKERGHQAIFLGEWKTRKGTRMVKYWASQGNATTGGYGVQSVEKSKVIHVIFSRLTNLDGLDAAVGLGTDPYLSSLLTTESSFAEALKMSGL